MSVLSFGAAEQALAGAWNQDAKSGLMIVTGRLISADQLFRDGDGLGGGPVDFQKKEIRLYSEQGLTDRWTLVSNTALFEQDYERGGRGIETTGFDQTEVGLQYQLARREGFAFSARAGVRLAGKSASNLPLALSNQDEIEGRILLGQSRRIGQGVIFYDAQLAIRSDFNGNYSGAEAALTLGWRPKESWLFMAQNYAVQQKSEGLFGDQDWLKTQFVAVKDLSDTLSVELGYTTTWTGQNVVDDQGVHAGLWVRY